MREQGDNRYEKNFTITLGWFRNGWKATLHDWQKIRIIVGLNL